MTPTAPDPAIVMDGVEKRFRPDAPPAVSGITTRIAPGIVAGLVGPDGAGKTTLMRMLAGLIKPTGGAIRVAGLDPFADSARTRAMIGYMPQRFGLYEDLSVGENFALYAALRGVDGVGGPGRLLEFAGLLPFIDRRAGHLSGGMKQKLGLACALLGRPGILLLDEPSVGVDPISRRDLWKMVRSLAREGMSILWATSYLDEAEMCAEVLLLHEGTLAFHGTPRSLLERVAGRTFQIRDMDGNRRSALRRALRHPAVSDGVIQGRNVRLVTKPSAEVPDATQLDAGVSASIVAVPARLEDAVVDILGGGPGADSPLAARMSEIPHAGDETVIEARSLTRRFGDFVAANDVSFAVRRGEVYGLLGPNGAGKSTTFRMMCGLLTPSSGTGLVNGIDIAHSAPRARQELGYMAQRFSLYGKLTVRRNLRFFSGIYGLAGRAQETRIGEMVELFDFRPFLDTTADELPLGFKQRLSLACAVMHEPEVLFLDEPTSGVDPISRREFWAHINGMAEKGVAVVVTTHYMDEAEYCDHVGLVYRGKLIASGTPDELRRMATTPDHPDPTMEDAFVALVGRHDREPA